MAHNLGVAMRRLSGMGTTRSLQAAGGLAADLYFALFAILRFLEPTTVQTGSNLVVCRLLSYVKPRVRLGQIDQQRIASSTGC